MIDRLINRVTKLENVLYSSTGNGSSRLITGTGTGRGEVEGRVKQEPGYRNN